MNLRTIAVLIACGMCASVKAQLRPHDRFAITAEQVTAKLMSAFAKDGVTLDAKQVVLPAGITSSEETPVLEVKSVEQVRGSEGTNSAIKLSCRNLSVCLPFYAMVTWPGSDRSEAGSNRTRLLSSANAQPVVTVVKSGAHVSLVMEHGTTRIQMGVISMENGGLHQQIRVRTSDRKQTYVAEVLDANTVKGTF